MHVQSNGKRCHRFYSSILQETEDLELQLRTVQPGVGAIISDLSKGTYYVAEVATHRFDSRVGSSPSTQQQKLGQPSLQVDGKVVAQLMITYEWSDWYDPLSLVPRNVTVPGLMTATCSMGMSSSRRNSQMWWIQSVYVHPNHRKQGLFRKLYEHVRGEAKSAGAGEIS